MRIFNIITGWKNYFQNETDQGAIERAEICRDCPSATVGSYEKFMPDRTLKNVQGLMCIDCGCPLSTKLRSPEEICPKGKW